MYDPQGLHQRFDNAVPQVAQAAIVKGIEVAYRLSDEECKREYDQRLHTQAWGYLRWLRVDSELLGVGDRFGKVGFFKPNTESTHIGHTELHFGDIVLTAASIQARGRRPRSAAYRDLLAESNQLGLFEHHRTANKDKLWGLILHVPNVAARHPLDVLVGFLTRDGFAGELIDLKKRMRRVSQQVEVLPTLRIRQKEGSGG